jgi:gluconolactonase
MNPLVFVALTSLLAADPTDIPKPIGDAIVPADARLELLFTRSAKINGGLTEGPAVAPDGSIYFSDIPVGKDKGMILRFDPKTGKTTVFSEDSKKSNGLKFDARGFLIACEGSDEGGQCVSRTDIKSGKRTVLVDKYMGKRLNAPNDLCIDLKGRIYFRPPLSRRRAARAGTPRRLPDRHRRQAGRGDTRWRETERHRAQPGPADALCRRSQQRH